MLSWAAGRFSQAALCFWNGGYLAFLCFSVLPAAMGTEHFFLAAAAAGGGVAAGVLTEKYRKLPEIIFAVVVFGQLFLQGNISLQETLFLSFSGGMGLYHASAGIIPDKTEIGKALLSGAGFLCGTILFSCF
ncbi:MAG: hypothetical protein IJE27_04785 [Anaerotignum sp.]|nr:hypothetical protein [Anaerotignum sp.]